jgi:hypothetical protein
MGHLTRTGIVGIPYDIITSLKLEKWLLSSTIRFKAPGLKSLTVELIEHQKICTHQYRQKEDL